MSERRVAHRRSADEIASEFHSWLRRAAIGYAILLAAIVVGFFRIGDEVEENSRQSAQIERTAEQLRAQSVEFCQRVADGRRDIQANRDVLLALVEAVLRTGLSEALVADFERAQRTLRQPVPSIACNREFER